MSKLSLVHHTKRAIAWLWLSIAVFILVVLLMNPTALEPQQLAIFFGQFENQIWLIFVLISLLRGIFLIPSLPFVLVGSLLFPNDGAWVVGVSLLGVFFSATFLYYFADWIGLGDYLLEKYPAKLQRCEYHLNKRYSFLLIMFWAFFPLVPTDLICYVARLVRMHYVTMITGILIGEIILISAVVFYFNENVSIID